jgi:hypothetical protein
MLLTEHVTRMALRPIDEMSMVRTDFLHDPPHGGI